MKERDGLGARACGKTAATFVAFLATVSSAASVAWSQVPDATPPPAATTPSAPSRAEDPTYDPPEPTPPLDAPYTQPPSQPIATLPILRDKSLLDEVPDLAIAPWPPPLRWKLEYGPRYPFQLFGIGVGAEGYVARVVRLSAFYSLGFGAAQGDFSISNYLEATVGFRLFGAGATLPITVKEPEEEKGKKPRPYDAPKRGSLLFRARIPSTHAFLFEVGTMAGNIPRLACTADCSPPTDSSSLHTVNPFLIYPMAGLRYVLWSAVTSKRKPAIDREFLVQAFLRGLYQPFNDAKKPLYWPGSVEPVERNRFGAVGGVSFPVCGHKCMKLGFEAGYLPSPATVMVSVSAGL